MANAVLEVIRLCVMVSKHYIEMYTMIIHEPRLLVKAVFKHRCFLPETGFTPFSNMPIPRILSHL